MHFPERTPTYPQPVLPVSTAETRPLWSVMIPVYNCSEYLPDVLEGVLKQDPGNDKMQIEVCDDASTDANVAQLVKQLGHGRVSYFRQTKNAGSLRNFETCLNRSRGHLIHLLHGDDKIRAGFYAKMERLFSTYSQMGAAFCRYVSIDQLTEKKWVSDLEKPEAGVLENWLEHLAYKQCIQAPSIVVRRKVYEHLGSFYGVHYGEDWEMWMRIAAHYDMGYLPDVLAEYRKHDNSISSQYILTGQNMRDIKQVMESSKKYFTADKWQAIHKKSRKYYAKYALYNAGKIWRIHKGRAAAKCQIREALGLSVHPYILFQTLKLRCKMFFGIKGGYRP